MKNEFDIILMDMQMPIMDRHSATTKIREHEKALHKQATLILARSTMPFQEMRAKQKMPVAAIT